MSVPEIINELTALAYRLDSMRRHQATTEGLKTTRVLREAAAILGTHSDEKPNDPLTLEELREMDGEPVWIVSTRGSGWCIVNWNGVNQSWMYYSRTGTAEGMTATPISARDYGNTWLAYRRRTEEGAV